MEEKIKQDIKSTTDTLLKIRQFFTKGGLVANIEIGQFIYNCYAICINYGIDFNKIDALLNELNNEKSIRNYQFRERSISEANEINKRFENLCQALKAELMREFDKNKDISSSEIKKDNNADISKYEVEDQMIKIKERRSFELEEKNKILDSKISESTVKLNDLLENIEKSSQELRDYKNKISEYKNEEVKLQNLINSTNMIYKKIIERNDRIKYEKIEFSKKEINEKPASTIGESTISQEKIDNLQLENEELKKELCDSKNKIKEIMTNDTIIEFMRFKEMQKINNTEIEQTNLQLNEKITELKNKIENYNNEIQKLEETKEIGLNETKKLKNEINALRFEHNNLTDGIKEKIEKYNVLNVKYKELFNLYNQIKKNTDNMRTTLLKMKSLIELLKKESGEFKICKKLFTDDKEKSQYKEDIIARLEEILKTKIEQEEKKSKAVFKFIEEAKTEKDNLEKEILVLRLELINIKKQIASY